MGTLNKHWKLSSETIERQKIAQRKLGANRRNKTYEEIYGKERANKVRKKISKSVHSNKMKFAFKEKSKNYKGDDASDSAFHNWLSHHYKKPKKCDNPDCKRTSKQFDWALIKDKKHSHNRKHYRVLCRQCHMIYDQINQKNNKNKQ